MATPNFFQQAKQAMELRSQVKKIQKQLESQTVDFENAGVKVTARGDMTIASIGINPEVIDMTRIDKLERTILELQAEARNAHPAERRQIEAELELALAERDAALAEREGRVGSEPPF